MDIDVAVVGAGPVGLTLASELRLAGARVTVLESLAAPSGVSKALGIGGRSVQMLERRGLLDRFAVAPEHAKSMRRFVHFGGIPLRLDRLGDLDVPFLPVPQSELELVLLSRATELGVEIRRQHEVIALRQQSSHVDIDVRTEGDTRTLSARYVVGCDGAHSAVRHLSGIEFPGLAPTELLRLADVTFPEGIVRPAGLELPDGNRVPFGLGALALVPLGGGVHRLVVREPYPRDLDREAPVSVEEISASVVRALGFALPFVSVRWLSRFSDTSRQAARYRVGRVLLAGDAAHVHLPAGGPGLNTGLQDAFDLGWKLAAELRGDAPIGLLDSYESERHPEGARVLMHTRAQGLLLSDDPRVGALRTLFAKLIDHDAVTRELVDTLFTLDVRYDMKLDENETHPMTGGWMPSVSLRGKGERKGDVPSLSSLTIDARPVLLDLADRSALRELATRTSDRVRVVRADCAEVNADALLLRPDGYVAWAARQGGDTSDAVRGLRRALATWIARDPEGE